jgi:hypothetical protein
VTKDPEGAERRGGSGEPNTRYVTLAVLRGTGGLHERQVLLRGFGCEKGSPAGYSRLRRTKRFVATNAAPWKDCEETQCQLSSVAPLEAFGLRARQRNSVLAKLEPTLFHHGASHDGWRWLKTSRWQARVTARNATALVRIRRRSNCPRACSAGSRRPRADGPWRQGPRPATGTPRRRRQRPGEHGPPCEP